MPLRSALAAALLGSPLVAAAQTLPSAPVPHPSPAIDPGEPALILEAGAATGWPFSGGTPAFGSDLAVEWTPIEHWLELETGVTTLFTHLSTEWDLDFLFKKPWDLSRSVEFMAGVGPEYANTRSQGRYTNTISAEVIGDLMVWPGGQHRVGWYLEPAYTIDLRNAHAQGTGLAAGLLLGIPHRARHR